MPTQLPQNGLRTFTSRFWFYPSWELSLIWLRRSRCTCREQERLSLYFGVFIFLSACGQTVEFSSHWIIYTVLLELVSLKAYKTGRFVLVTIKIYVTDAQNENVVLSSQDMEKTGAKNLWTSYFKFSFWGRTLNFKSKL